MAGLARRHSASPFLFDRVSRCKSIASQATLLLSVVEKLIGCELAHVGIVERHRLGRCQIDAVADALPSSQFVVDARSGYGRDVLGDAGRNDVPAGLQEPPARIGERRDDVFFERIVAERFGDDDVDGELVAKLRRMTWNEMARLRLVGLQNLRGDAGDLCGFKQEDVFGAELRCHQAKQPGTGADIGHDGFSGLYDRLQRPEKSVVSNFVGNERAVIFDAHGSELQPRAAHLIQHQCGRDGEVERSRGFRTSEF